LAYFGTPTQITPATMFVVTPDGGSPISLYESYRIFFTHLPSAFATAACCALTGVGGVLLLLTRKPQWETLIISAAEGGLCTGALVLGTGSMWASFAWNTYWNWEPRLTTMLILWLAFAGLLVVRQAMDNNHQRTMMTAVYGILLAPLYPLVSKAVEFSHDLHPQDFEEHMSAPEIAFAKKIAGVAVLIALMAIVALRYQWNELGRQIAKERAS
jgi:heme exporter protein C